MKKAWLIAIALLLLFTVGCGKETVYTKESTDLIIMQGCDQFYDLGNGSSVRVVISQCLDINPFKVGQTIYPNGNFLRFNEEFETIAQDGVKVIDITISLVRVMWSDGNEGTYHWSYFVDQKESMALSDDWLIGNIFAVGQEVCATLSSTSLGHIPTRGIIQEIAGRLITLEEEEDRWFDHKHFQKCIE